MATKLLDIIQKQVRPLLLEKTETADAFWTDQELLDIAIAGCHDLWRAQIDEHQDHFITVADGTGGTADMALVSGAKTISGVPADLFRVLLIQPRDTTDQSATRNLLFLPARYNSRDFRSGLARGSIDPNSGGCVRYAIASAGPPSTTMTIYVAPTIEADVSLRCVYVPILGTLTILSDNPIPGQSDLAIKAWIVAHAMAKETEDRMPDPNWLMVYNTEKKSILVAGAPRQEQEPRCVRGVFDGLYDGDDDWLA